MIEKSSNFSLFLILITLFCFIHLVRAEGVESPVDAKSRKGLILGFHLGAGGISANGTQTAGPLFAFKMGHGITEKIQLIGDFTIDTAFSGDARASIYAISLSPEIFLNEKTYIRMGAGYSWFEQWVDNCGSFPIGCSSAFLPRDNGKGFSLSSAFGYEMIRDRKSVV